jgi:HNH endonuclease
LQFRVLKRENQICRACGKPVQDEDIHFDHIIPWSKGGPTEDHNIRLLCGDCNRRKGANFERDHLVAGLQELVSKPVDFEFVRMLRWLVSTGHAWRQEKKRMPTPKDIATVIGSRKVTEYEEALSQIFQDLDHFFSGGPPEELETELFEALRHRWGFEGGKIHKLSTVAKDRGLRPTDLLAAEISLVSRLGWRVVLSPSQQKKWLAV